MKKFRIIEKDGKFYPQYYKNLFFKKWYYFKMDYIGCDYPPYSPPYKGKAELDSLDSAVNFIEEQIKNKIINYYYLIK